MTILILSSEADVHAVRVGNELAKLEADYTILSFDQLIFGGDFQAVFERSWKMTYSPRGELAGRLDLSKLRAIWFRRPGEIKSKHLAADWVASMVNHESKLGLSGLFAEGSQLCVNNFFAQEQARLKSYQLKKALEAGLSVPKTLLTNDPKAVREFYEQVSGEMIYKLIDERSFASIPANEPARTIPVVSFEESDLNYLDQVTKSLHLFQEKIQKGFDLRICVLDQQIYAAKIEPVAGNIDWRLDPNPKISIIDIEELKPGLTRQIFSLLKSMDLIFASLDFVVDYSGEVYFLEVNPQGQFLFIEDALGYPISKQLATILAAS